MYPLPIDASFPLAGSKARMMGLGNAFPIAAEPIAFPAAELLFPVPEADEFFSAAITNQTVWLPAAEMVPPLVTASVAAKNLACATRGVR